MVRSNVLPILTTFLTCNHTFFFFFFCSSNCCMHKTVFSFFLFFMFYLHPSTTLIVQPQQWTQRTKEPDSNLRFYYSLSFFTFSFPPQPNLLSHLMLTISLIVAPPTPLSSQMEEPSNLIAKPLLSQPQLKMCKYHFTQISPLLFLLHCFLCIKLPGFFKRNPPTPFTYPKLVDFGFVFTSSLSLTLRIT